MPITRGCKQSNPLYGGTGSIGSSTPETCLFMVPFPTRRSNGSGRRKIPCPSWEIRTTGFFESWQGNHWTDRGGKKKGGCIYGHAKTSFPGRDGSGNTWRGDEPP